jgi:hypothetical protein
LLRYKEGRVAVFIGAQADKLKLDPDEDHYETSGGWKASVRYHVSMSYSASYIDAAVAVAESFGVKETTIGTGMFGYEQSGKPGPWKGVKGAYFLGNFNYDKQARTAAAPENIRRILEGQKVDKKLVEILVRGVLETLLPNTPTLDEALGDKSSGPADYVVRVAPSAVEALRGLIAKKPAFKKSVRAAMKPIYSDFSGPYDAKPLSKKVSTFKAVAVGARKLVFDSGLGLINIVAVI